MILKQVSSLKKNVTSLETLVNEDIFQMLDNMSLCVTQKDNEVQTLTSKVTHLEEEHKSLRKQLKN